MAVPPIIEGPQVGAGFVKSQEAVAAHIGKSQVTGVTVTEEDGGSVRVPGYVPHLQTFVHKGLAGYRHLVALDGGWNVPEAHSVQKAAERSGDHEVLSSMGHLRLSGESSKASTTEEASAAI